MLSQIDLSHEFIFCKFLCGTIFQDPAFKHQIGAVCDRKGFLNVVIRDQDPDVLGLEPCDDVLNILNRDRIDPRKRLIQKYEFWICCQ